MSRSLPDIGVPYLLTEKSFLFDSRDQTVQRVLVDQAATFLISRLVHDPRLHHVGRGPHYGSDQPGTGGGHGVGQGVVLQAAVVQDAPLDAVVG